MATLEMDFEDARQLLALVRSQGDHVVDPEDLEAAYEALEAKAGEPA